MSYNLGVEISMSQHLDDINSTLKQNNEDIAEILYAMLCKDSDMWKCEYSRKSKNDPYRCDIWHKDGEFILKMEISGRILYDDIKKTIVDKINEEMKWSGNEVCWGFMLENKTYTKFDLYCRNDYEDYEFKITKVY